MNYYTSTPNAPPKALAGIDAVPFDAYGQNFADNYRPGSNAYDMAVTRAQDDYQGQRLGNQRQSVLAGLQLMADEQERRNNMATSRLQQVTGLASALGGLYR
jgi:hypothetical protein